MTKWGRPAIRVVGLVLLVATVLVGGILTHNTWSDWLFGVTGEQRPAAQLRGTLEWLGNLTRPQPKTADMVPVANAGANPYGVNAFLEQEVEPAKREQAVRMIAEAGFHWIRQEFPWEDIEIHGKGDFEDRRNEPARSAWDKYDAIVDLADRYGLEMIVRLSNPPAWTRAQGDKAGTFGPPDDLNDYGDFVETVVRRYRGRIRHYQIWNEPNIYPEWGEQPVSPEGYTELLRMGHGRVKAVCPECIVISGALAQTIPLGPRNLTDLIFLQRMYNAGAGSYFDVLAIQGYGLWSGPTDRRMRPRVLNFSRPLYIREIMVLNGDAHKPIWITEMNWNASPADLPDKPFGFVTLEEQAQYAVLAYERAQREWPWVGVVNFWFFKRATDTEQDQPMYYFRMVEPDFTPMPVYEALKEHMHRPPTLYRGVHQEEHWALSFRGTWETQIDPTAELGAYRRAASADASLTVRFEGSDLWLKAGPGVEGVVAYNIDGDAERLVTLESGESVALARRLSRGAHTLVARQASGVLAIDSLTVRNRLPAGLWLAVAGAAVLIIGVAVVLGSRPAVRRRRWYEHGRSRR